MGKCENVIYLGAHARQCEHSTAGITALWGGGGCSRFAARELGLAFGFGEGTDSMSKKLGTEPPLWDAPA